MRDVASGRSRVVKSSADIVPSYPTASIDHCRLYQFHHCRFRFCGYATTAAAGGGGGTADFGMFNLSVKLP